MRAVPPAIAMLALLLALAACGTAIEGTATPSPTDAWGLEQGSPVPDMAVSVYQGAEDLGGEEVRLSEVLEGGRPVVLNFWAALCPPCRIEMPEFQRVYEARSHEVLVLGIDIGPQQHLGTREEGRMLLQELGVTYPAGTTFDDQVAFKYELLGMPTTLFIHRDGRLLRSWSGLLTEEKLNELVDQLVAG